MLGKKTINQCQPLRPVQQAEQHRKIAAEKAIDIIEQQFTVNGDTGQRGIRRWREAVWGAQIIGKFALFGGKIHPPATTRRTVVHVVRPRHFGCL